MKITVDHRRVSVSRRPTATVLLPEFAPTATIREVADESRSRAHRGTPWLPIRAVGRVLRLGVGLSEDQRTSLHEALIAAIAKAAPAHGDVQ